ncbi:MAG: methyltransferase domain-containing protein [Candidatus Aminicenantes bacterium]
MFWWRKGLHKLRFTLKNWSSEKDREYHDDVFQSSVKQPFRSSYTGYITIRRFADLASSFIQGSQKVLDIGCGTGEITCELASRFPDVFFTGIDPSSSGIKRAQSHARFLKLDNVVFQQDTAEAYTPSNPVDLVMLFDAFHHLEKPRSFVKKMGKFTRHFLLIEPKGDWKGSWDKTLDLDWMILELDKIQKRLGFIMDEKELPVETNQTRISKGDAVENRYSLQDFKNIFKGYGLKLRGTISGLDEYPPGSSATGHLRELFGEWAYQIYRDMDDYLYQNNLDFWAKHWVIEARKGAPHKLRKPSSKPEAQRFSHSKIQGPYQVNYITHTEVAEDVPASSHFQLQATLQNTGFLPWYSVDASRPVFVSYHWQDHSGKTVIYDGKRTSFAKQINPGEKTTVSVSIKTPDSQGRYVLAVDLVCEGVTWFSQCGNPPLFIPVQVKKAG